jgi:hypothetical protein
MPNRLWMVCRQHVEDLLVELLNLGSGTSTVLYRAGRINRVAIALALLMPPLADRLVRGHGLDHGQGSVVHADRDRRHTERSKWSFGVAHDAACGR